MLKPLKSSLLLCITLFSLLSLACSLSKPASTATRLPAATTPPTASNTPSPVFTASPTITANPAPSHTPTFTATQTLAPTATPSASPSPTPTLTNTPTSSSTPTPTIAPTPTITFTPTYSFPRYTALMQANCRYGPGTDYLYAAGFYTGDTGAVWGRNASGTWLWVQPDNIKYECWVATSVVAVVGNVMSLRVAPVRLPHSTVYGPPSWVKAERNGNQVIVTWAKVSMTEDDNRGYFLEANVCQKGNLVGMAVQTNETTYTFTDETTCDEKSNGLLYTVEKHGYTDPIKIKWPK